MPSYAYCFDNPSDSLDPLFRLSEATHVYILSKHALRIHQAMRRRERIRATRGSELA
jgi:hypothetical protein